MDYHSDDLLVTFRPFPQWESTGANTAKEEEEEELTGECREGLYMFSQVSWYGHDL
jgi:hypothetical protein